MRSLEQDQAHAARIRNAAYLVRHYRRPVQQKQRALAIQELGRACRDAFNHCDDFELVLTAIVEGLKPHDYTPPF